MTADAPIDRATLLAALDGILDPKSGLGLNAAGLVRGLILAPGRAGFMLEVPAGEVADYQPVRDAAEALIAGLPGVIRAQVVLTAEAPAGRPSATVTPVGAAPQRRTAARVSEDPAARPAPSCARGHRGHHRQNRVATSTTPARPPGRFFGGTMESNPCTVCAWSESMGERPAP